MGQPSYRDRVCFEVCAQRRGGSTEGDGEPVGASERGVWYRAQTLPAHTDLCMNSRNDPSLGRPDGKRALLTDESMWKSHVLASRVQLGRQLPLLTSWPKCPPYKTQRAHSFAGCPPETEIKCQELKKKKWIMDIKREPERLRNCQKAKVRRGFF